MNRDPEPSHDDGEQAQESDPQSNPAPKKFTPNRFDPKIAETHGIPAALILNYIRWRSRESRDGWVLFTIDELREKYPYMGRDECWRGLSNLLGNGKKTAPLVSRKEATDGCGYCYRPRDKYTGDFRAGMHTFDVEVAKRVGIVPALIYHNIGFWIKQNWMLNAEELYRHFDPEKFDYDDALMQRLAYQQTRKAAAHYGSIKKWWEHHRYISLATAKRGFRLLVGKGMLEKGATRARIPLWFLPRRQLVVFEQIMLRHRDLGNEKLKTKRSGSKPND